MATTRPIVRRQFNLPAFAGFLLAITTILLVIRLASRWRRMGAQLGADDVLIFLGWLTGFPMGVFIILEVTQNHFDRHVWDIPQDDWVSGALYGFVIEILFLLSTCFTKVSVLMFYRRLVDGTCSRKFKYAIWAGISFVIAYTIGLIIVLLSVCRPLDAIWDQYAGPDAPAHSCRVKHGRVAGSYVAGGLSVFTDWYSVMLPCMLLLRLQIRPRQRYALMFIFGLGYFVIGAGIARTILHGKVEAEPLDKAWKSFAVFIPTLLECLLGICCACGPSLKPLFGKFFRDMTTNGSSSRWNVFPGTVGSAGGFVRRGSEAFGLGKMLSSRHESTTSSAARLSKNAAMNNLTITSDGDEDEDLAIKRGPYETIYELDQENTSSSEASSSKVQSTPPASSQAPPQWGITKTLDITVTESHDEKYEPPSLDSSWKETGLSRPFEAYGGTNPQRSRSEVSAHRKSGMSTTFLSQPASLLEESSETGPALPLSVLTVDIPSSPPGPESSMMTTINEAYNSSAASFVSNKSTIAESKKKEDTT